MSGRSPLTWASAMSGPCCADSVLPFSREVAPGCLSPHSPLWQGTPVELCRIGPNGSTRWLLIQPECLTNGNDSFPEVFWLPGGHMGEREWLIWYLQRIQMLWSDYNKKCTRVCVLHFLVLKWHRENIFSSRRWVFEHTGEMHIFNFPGGEAVCGRHLTEPSASVVHFPLRVTSPVSLGKCSS